MNSQPLSLTPLFVPKKGPQAPLGFGATGAAQSGGLPGVGGAAGMGYGGGWGQPPARASTPAARAPEPLPAAEVLSRGRVCLGQGGGGFAVLLIGRKQPPAPRQGL